MFRYLILACLVSVAMARMALNQAAIGTLLKGHNDARKREDPSIPNLTWDNNLANFAAGLTDKCIFAHTQGNSNGENIYMSWGSNPSAQQALDGASKSWVGERSIWLQGGRNWNCIISGSCGHFSQVVWRSTSKVGCAVSKCPGSKTLVACEYYPPGNMIKSGPNGQPVAQNPY